jgi:aminoglycoside 3-N-acetyltransferase
MAKQQVSKLLSASRSTLTADLIGLGITLGDVVMVHGSLRQIGPIVGGVNVLLDALFDCVGKQGTLVAYIDFEPFYEEHDPKIPVFDKHSARARRDHGILHEALRIWPGTQRSDHPDASVIANGRLADWLVSEHPFQYGYGPGTPFERVLLANGKVAMLGAPLDTITLLHHAEHLAEIPDKRMRRYRRLMPTPQGARWIDFEEFDTSDPVHSSLPELAFQQIAEDYLASGKGRLGRVGRATSYCFDAQDLVFFGKQWIEKRVNSD